jgi:hypothetical protein
VSLSVSVSKLEMGLDSCNSNWRRFTVDRSSSLSPRELIPAYGGCHYVALRLEERLLSLKVYGEGTHCSAPSSASLSSQ